MEHEILEIKALIDKLRATDTEFRIFGADSHRYRIGPKLSELEIRNFEQKHGITLPEDYRLYLQLVGNGNGTPWRERTGAWVRGGAGPYYGLYPLDETVNGKRVSQPFLFTEECEIEYDPEDPWEADVPGLIEIAHQGCQGTAHLVVNGEASGTVWDGVDYDYFYPTHLTFSQWMRAWAEKNLLVFDNKPLVERIKVGMTKEEVISATGEDWIERTVSDKTLFENARMRAQLELDDKHVVTTILSYF
jgi:hypothetical protein